MGGCDSWLTGVKLGILERVLWCGFGAGAYNTLKENPNAVCRKKKRKRGGRSPEGKKAGKDVDLEELEDAAVHQLQDAGDDPGRAAAGGQVHGLRPPHEPGAGRLRGVPEAAPGQGQEALRGPRGPPHSRPAPPPRRGGRLHDRRGPAPARRVARQVGLRRRRSGTRGGPGSRPGRPHGPPRPGPARAGRPRPRRGRPCARDDAAADLPAPGVVPAPRDAAPGAGDVPPRRSPPAEGPAPPAGAVRPRVQAPRPLPRAPPVRPAAHGPPSRDDAGPAPAPDEARHARHAPSPRRLRSCLRPSSPRDAPSPSEPAAPPKSAVISVIHACQVGLGSVVVSKTCAVATTYLHGP